MRAHRTQGLKPPVQATKLRGEIHAENEHASLCPADDRRRGRRLDAGAAAAIGLMLALAVIFAIHTVMGEAGYPVAADPARVNQVGVFAMLALFMVAATGDLYFGLAYPIVFTVISILATLFLLAETRGRSLDDVHDIRKGKQ